jgi:pimeloyl-ACP methyl ester carboxylesterase
VDTTRVLTPARIVALVAILAVVLGLVSLRVLSGEEEVVVPEGAEAGDLVTEPCTYETEAGDRDAECGTLVVHESSTDPQSRLIALPVIRVLARSDQPAEPVFFMEGGPGGTNLSFPEASRFAEDRDVVLVGYRGVDGSVRLECPEVTSALQNGDSWGSEASFDAYADAYGDCAARLTADGIDLSRYGLVQQVEDFEAARTALGYERIDLLSESAGTRTAMIYSWRHPESIHRSVMVGVNPPGNFLWDPGTTDEQIGRYADRCASDPTCSRRTDDLAATLRTDVPDRWMFLPIKDANVRIASMFGLFEPTSKAFPVSGPMVIDSWLSATEGDPSGMWFASVFGDLLFPNLFVWGQYVAAGRVDLQAADAYFGPDAEADPRNFAFAATSFGWGGGRAMDHWPAAVGEDEYDRVPTSDVETLLVGGELDVSTPPQTATQQLLPSLANGREVVLEGFGHTGSVFAVQPGANRHLINTFLDTGRVDTSLYRPLAVDLTPSTTLTGLAKAVLAILVGLGLVALLVLLWLVLRVRRRGTAGPVVGAVVRSTSALFLGLGGWSLAVMIVLATGVSIPLSSEPLAVIAIGVPVGLGSCVAWYHRDWAAGTKAVGVLSAGAGALLGAWLGFNATTALLALFAAAAGAAAGANLPLVVLDMRRAAAQRPGGGSAAAAPATHAETGSDDAGVLSRP